MATRISTTRTPVESQAAESMLPRELHAQPPDARRRAIAEGRIRTTAAGSCSLEGALTAYPKLISPRCMARCKHFTGARPFGRWCSEMMRGSLIMGVAALSAACVDRGARRGRAQRSRKARQSFRRFAAKRSPDARRHSPSRASMWRCCRREGPGSCCSAPHSGDSDASRSRRCRRRPSQRSRKPRRN